MLCFKCGRQGHKEEAYVLDNHGAQEAIPQAPKETPAIDCQDHTYGSWMLVKEPVRRSHGRSQSIGTGTRGPPN